jgi:hypothetical protein
MGDDGHILMSMLLKCSVIIHSLKKEKEMNSGHRVNVVRINEILPHTNADTLGIVMIGGYQVVVKKDNYKAGDLAIYLQPDSVVPQTKPFEFLWADKEFPDGIVPEKYRRITVRRFRKEYSEGLLLPVSDFVPHYLGTHCDEGVDVAEQLGVTHYVEPEPIDIHGKNKQQEKGWPRSLKGWYYLILRFLGLRKNSLEGNCERAPKNAPPVYDVENFKNYHNTFQDGEDVIVTEKIHGSNGRYMFDSEEMKMWVGSKNLWKSEKSNCIWRRALKELPWIENFCRTYPKRTLYVEVVPTQKGYDYGTNVERPVRAFGFDVYDPEINNGLGGYWHKEETLHSVEAVSGFIAPVLYHGPFDLPSIKKFVDGKTTVSDAKHIREGIVVATARERYERGLGRVQLKIKSMKFLESEGKA